MGTTLERVSCAVERYRRMAERGIHNGRNLAWCRQTGLHVKGCYTSPFYGGILTGFTVVNLDTNEGWFVSPDGEIDPF